MTTTSELQFNPIEPQTLEEHHQRSEKDQEEEKEEEILSTKIERINDYQITPTYLFRICLLGDSNVGKTSIITRFCDSAFKDHYSNTIGIDFRVVTVKFENITAKIHIWDTAGQERFKSLASNYFRNSHGFIFVYDVTNQGSFENVNEWIDAAFSYNKDNCVASFLVGNKCDRREERVVNREEGERLGKEKGFFFEETSARNDENVQKIFYKMIYKFIKFFEKNKDKYVNDIEKSYLKLDNKYEELKTIRTGNKKCKC